MLQKWIKKGGKKDIAMWISFVSMGFNMILAVMKLAAGIMAGSDALEPKEALPAEDSGKLPMDDVRENKNYGNDRLMKMTKGHAKKILLGIACLFFAAVVGFIIWALVR